MTDLQISKVLNSMVIIVDTREKKNEHIIEFLKKEHIPYRVDKVDSGDYTFECNMRELNRKVCVERKNSLDEISQNLSKNRERFIREFERAKTSNTKMHIVIENTTFKKLKNGSYRSKISPNSFIASLLTWNNRYDVPIWFSGKDECGWVIVNILHYGLRELLKNI